MVSTNYWGSPLKRTGEFFASHNQTIVGFLGLPSWLGVSTTEKYTSQGLKRLFLGPLLTKTKSAFTVSAAPYCDAQSGRLDLQLKVSYLLLGAAKE